MAQLTLSMGSTQRDYGDPFTTNWSCYRKVQVFCHWAKKIKRNQEQESGKFIHSATSNFSTTCQKNQDVFLEFCQTDPISCLINYRFFQCDESFHGISRTSKKRFSCKAEWSASKEVNKWSTRLSSRVRKVTAKRVAAKKRFYFNVYYCDGTLMLQTSNCNRFGIQIQLILKYKFIISSLFFLSKRKCTFNRYPINTSMFTGQHSRFHNNVSETFETKSVTIRWDLCFFENHEFDIFNILMILRW